MNTPDDSESLGGDSFAEVCDEDKRQQFCAKLSDKEASTPARKKPFDLIFDGVMAIYPDLNCIQLYSMVRKIQKENNNTLKDLSMNQILDQILDQVFELKAQESLETNKNTAQSAQKSVSAPLFTPVLLGVIPKIQLATQEKGNNKEKMDDSTPKKVHLDSKSEAKDEKNINIKFNFTVKFDSDQAALDMIKGIEKALTGMEASTGGQRLQTFHGKLNKTQDTA